MSYRRMKIGIGKMTIDSYFSYPEDEQERREYIELEKKRKKTEVKENG